MRSTSKVRYASAYIRQWLRLFRGNVDLLIITAALLIVVGSLTFMEVADAVNTGSTQHLDDYIVKIMRNPADLADPVGPPWLKEAGRDITALGGVTVLAIVKAAVAGFLLLRKLYGALAFLLIATTGGLAFTLILKGVFERPRPELVPHLSYVVTSSFPSGHSMLSAAVYLTMGTLLGRLVKEFKYKLYIVGVACFITMLIGISRVYMGVHYPTDVLAGWAAGLSWALLCWLVSYSLQKRGAIQKNGKV
jgi:undecaprenyl-diphosphatase